MNTATATRTKEAAKPQRAPKALATAARSRSAVLELAIEKRLMKIGCACVPDLRYEIGIEATEEELRDAAEALRARGAVRRIEDEKAKTWQQYVYELI